MNPETTILLKRDNVPTRPGRHAWREFPKRVPIVSQVDMDGGELCVLMPPSLWFPVAEMDPGTLWSDPLTFTTEEVR